MRKMKLKRGIALTALSAGVMAPMFTISAAPAHADGVYFCYYAETISSGGTRVPYVVPASITTQPYQCPPGTVALQLV